MSAKSRRKKSRAFRIRVRSPPTTTTRPLPPSASAPARAASVIGTGEVEIWNTCTAKQVQTVVGIPPCRGPGSALRCSKLVSTSLSRARARALSRSLALHLSLTAEVLPAASTCQWGRALRCSSRHVSTSLFCVLQGSILGLDSCFFGSSFLVTCSQSLSRMIHSSSPRCSWA
jgi:hypothetical protein